jgi:hypothetical protein
MARTLRKRLGSGQRVFLEQISTGLGDEEDGK